MGEPVPPVFLHCFVEVGGLYTCLLTSACDAVSSHLACHSRRTRYDSGLDDTSASGAAPDRKVSLTTVTFDMRRRFRASGPGSSEPPQRAHDWIQAGHGAFAGHGGFDGRNSVQTARLVNAGYSEPRP
jgi:hypothetical protein